MVEKAKIVQTPGTLSGRPRIDGHRIAVSDIWLSYLRALEDLAVPMIRRDFPHLTEEQVREALYYAHTHMKDIERELEEDLKAAREAGVEPY
jgi:uncharacterized protein (DUF433 family)